MLATKTVDISEKLYARARRVAQTRHQEVSELIATILDENLPPLVAVEEEIDAAADREMNAYIAMHPELKAKFLGKHVAVHGGQLVDMDDDYEALYLRIDKKYPDQYVWLTTVREEPIPTLTFRSPRILRV
ncbi:MAG: DUF5678 domain-containing protein [Candidatus Promineifilaceae bacterium]